MDSLTGVWIKGHGLILIADLKGRIFNGPIVEAEGDLLQIAKPACTVGIVQVGVHPVVSDDSGKCRSLAKSLRGKLGQEGWHEMIVPLDIEAIHTLRRDARTTVTADTRQQGSRSKSDRICCNG